MAISYDELYYNAAHIFTYNGEPYTGEVEDRFPDGTLQCRFHFVNGRQHGITESYFASGARQSLEPYMHGAVHGCGVEWHENGTVKCESEFEFGFVIRSREFDQHGQLTNEYVRPDDDAIMKLIKERRRQNAT